MLVWVSVCCLQPRKPGWSGGFHFQLVSGLWQAKPRGFPNSETLLQLCTTISTSMIHPLGPIWIIVLLPPEITSSPLLSQNPWVIPLLPPSPFLSMHLQMGESLLLSPLPSLAGPLPPPPADLPSASPARPPVSPETAHIRGHPWGGH